MRPIITSALTIDLTDLDEAQQRNAISAAWDVEPGSAVHLRLGSNLPAPEIVGQLADLAVERGLRVHVTGNDPSILRIWLRALSTTLDVSEARPSARRGQ